jgi:hypothetical protein
LHPGDKKDRMTRTGFSAFAAFLVALVCTFAPGTRTPGDAAEPGTTASLPLPLLVPNGDASYGLAYGGGNACLAGMFLPTAALDAAGCGAILRFDSGGRVSIVHSFVPRDGALPGTLRVAASGALLGVTNLGGAHGRGTAFRFDPKTGRYDVLQSLGDDGASAAAGDFPGGYAASFDDGTVLAENQPAGTFFVLAGGKAARAIYQFPPGTDVGPFAIGWDDRAVFTVKPPGACDVALVSLGLDGTLMHVEDAARSGAPECAGNVLADVVRVHLGFDGSVVANDADRIFVAAPGRPFSVVYTRPGAPGAAAPGVATPAAGDGAELLAGSAIAASNGDVIAAEIKTNTCGSIVRIHHGVAEAAGDFDGTNICVAPADTAPTFALGMLQGDGIGGTYTDQSTTQGFAFAVVAGKAPVTTKAFAYPTPVKDSALAYAFFPSFSPALAIAGHWTATGTLALPPFSADPRAFDIAMKNLTNAGSAPVHVPASGTKRVAPTRTNMTMEQDVAIDVPVTLPRLVPGRYEFVVHASAALRTQSGTHVAVVNDGAPTFWLVTALDLTAASPDPELKGLTATFGGHTVTVSADFPLTCDGSGDATIVRGSPLHVNRLSRGRASPALTGYGPLGVHRPGPGDMASAYAPFIALDPITIAFATFQGCDSPSATFAAAWDVTRYLKR